MSVEVMGGGGSANLQSKSILPSLLPYTQTPDPGYDGLSSVEVRKPSTLIASNIKSGVSIFGVQGSAETGSGTFVSAAERPTANSQSITFTMSRPASLDGSYIKLVAFSISGTWSGSLSNGDIFRGYFIAEPNNVSSTLHPIKSNNSETEFIGMLTGKGYDDQVYGKFNYGTLRADSSNIYFTIRCQDSALRWSADTNYTINAWFNNSDD